MADRALLVVGDRPGTVADVCYADLGQWLEGNGLHAETVVVPALVGAAPSDASHKSPDASRASRGPLRPLVKFKERLRRAATRRADRLASLDTWWSVRRAGMRAVRVVGRSGRQRRAEGLYSRFASPDRLAPGGAFTRAHAEHLLGFQAGVLHATFSLPRSILMEPTVLARVVGALADHHSDPFVAAVAPAGDVRAVAVAYAVSRITDLPLVLLDGVAPATEGALPPEESLLLRFARERASVRVAAAPAAAAPDRTLSERVAESAARSAVRSTDRPVLTALIEATGDTPELRASIDALRVSRLPNWEAIVVVDASDPIAVATITAALDELSDPRVRVIATEVELLDLYNMAVRHAARADFFVRVQPGFRVDADFVTRVACAVLRPDPAEGYCWLGRISKPDESRPAVGRAFLPIPIALRDLRTRWYSLEGEYVMNWRLFRAFGGFCHSDAQVHSSHVEEIVLSESAALSGLLFDPEVPLAYKWMATLSKRMGKRSASSMPASYAIAPPVGVDDLDTFDPAAGHSAAYAGKTVLFVRHHLVSYDARLLKEASTLIGMGARCVVLGGAEEPPASLVEQGLEVIALPGSDTRSRLSEIYAEIAPDIVHAYDVLSYDLIEPVLDDSGPKLVYECRDLIVAPGYLSEAERGAQRVRERRIIERADAVVAVSGPSADWIGEEYGIDDVAVIVHGSMEVAREPSPVGAPVRILFQGAFRPNRGLFSLVTAVRGLRGRAHLTFQGFGVMEHALREYVRQEELESHVDFIEACGPLDVVRSAVPFDVGVVCYAGSTENLRRTAPNKLIDYMSAGLALVVPELPGIRSLADETHGVFFEPGSAHDLMQAIESLIVSDEVLADHKAASLERGREHRWAVEQRKLVALYSGLLGIDATGAEAPSSGQRTR